jgi:uncharacterized protein YbjT (DUF2867 family)
VILLTGATGTVGQALLPLLLEGTDPVRCFVREPRGLGSQRVRVQIALGDLADPGSFRNALRGVDTVIHLAAAIRDQPGRGRLEELNGLATARLLRAAERAGVKRFVFFSAIGAAPHQRTRFFRSKALAEAAVRESRLRTTIFRPSIVYDRDDPWVRLIRRLSLLPALPISGSGHAAYQPIWAADVARCILASLRRRGSEVFELAGPEVLTYDDMASTIARAAGRERRLVHVPLPLVRWTLMWLRWLVGPPVFATWEEAELMEVPMTTRRGTDDAQALGVTPRQMAEVLG